MPKGGEAGRRDCGEAEEAARFCIFFTDLLTGLGVYRRSVSDNGEVGDGPKGGTNTTILARNELPSYKVGRHRRIKLADVERWLEDNKYRPASKGDDRMALALTNPLLQGRVPLAPGIEEGIDPPEELEPSVLLTGKVHHIFAGAGEGKTMFSLGLVRNAIERDEAVAFFDTENGQRIVAERLGKMGVDTSKVDEYLYYIPSPTMPLTAEGAAVYEQMLDEVRPSLVIFDSWINFLAGSGCDENSNTDVARWCVTYTHPARNRGIAVVLLDHVPHDGKHARGATRKKDEVDVQWKLKKTNPSTAVPWVRSRCTLRRTARHGCRRPCASL